MTTAAPTPKIRKLHSVADAPKRVARTSAKIEEAVEQAIQNVELPPPVAEPAIEALAAVIAPETIPPVPTPPIMKVMSMAAPQIKHGYEEFASFGKANIDALIQANSVFVAGFESLSKEFLSLTKTSMEQAAAATSAMLAAKSLKDVVELNVGFSKSQYELMVANTTKLGEMSVKLATDTVAPITARANSVVGTVVQPKG